MRASQARELVRTLTVRQENKLLQDILSFIAKQADVGKEEVEWTGALPEFVKKELHDLGYKLQETKKLIAVLDVTQVTTTITWKE